MAGKHAECPGWQAAELGHWADSKPRFNSKYLERQTRPDYDWPARLRRITCPVLLITADPALGAIVNEQQAAAFAAAVPQLRLAHIPGAGTTFAVSSFRRIWPRSGTRAAPGRGQRSF